MTWTQNTTTKVWTNTGAGRSVVVSTPALPGRSAIVLAVPTVAYNVKAIVPSSIDGRTCYECGIEGANVVIRRVAFGVVGSNATNGAADTPPSAAASVAHGIAAGVPYVMDVRLYEGVIEIRLNGTLFIRHTIDTDDYFTVGNAYANLRYYGFVSEVSGAIVSKAEIAPLVQSEPSPMTEVLVMFCDGNIVISEDGVNAKTVAVGAFGNEGLIAAVEYQRKVWAVGTGFARVFDPDPNALSISPWVASAGTFPGSSGLSAGQTRCTLLENFLDRLVLAGDPIDPQNAIMTAVGDATDFDTDADTAGRAFELSTGLTGRIGQPITCIKQAANGVMAFGCTSQMWRLVGDPALGTPSLTPASLSSGITSKDSAALADASTLVVHSPDGAFTVGSGPGEPAIPLSAPVLRTGIELDREEALTVYQIVVRDPGRKLTHFFITPIEEGPTTHYVYDEVMGRFDAARGGWFEDVYDPSIGPTAACMFRGKLCIGTRDGRVLYFDDAATSDDGQAFESVAPLTLVDSKMSNHDTVRVDLTSVVLASDSDPIELRVYRGRTAQEAMIGSERSLGWKRTVGVNAGLIRQTVSAPALCFEIWNTSADRGWDLESVSVDYSVNRNAFRAGWKTPTTPAAPCTIQTGSGGDPDPGPEPEPLPDLFVDNGGEVTASVLAFGSEMPDPNLVYAAQQGGMTGFNAVDTQDASGATDSEDGTSIDYY